jgi:hypothetical protein
LQFNDNIHKLVRGEPSVEGSGGARLLQFMNGTYTDAFSNIAAPIKASTAIPKMRYVADYTRKEFGKSHDEQISSLANRSAAALDAFADSIETHGGHFNAAIFGGGMDQITTVSTDIGDFCG